MKLLVFNWQDIKNPFGGGAEVHLHEIFSRVAKLGFDVTLFCSSFKGAKSEEEIDGIKIIRRGSRSFFNFFVPIYYNKIFRSQKFDVIIDDINKIPFFTPLFVKQPIIGIVHHLFGKSIFHETNFLFASYVSIAEKLLPQVYGKTKIAAVSESTKNELQKIGFKNENIFLLPNCVDNKKYKLGKQKNSNAITIGFLGRLKKYKSIDIALKAFAIVKEKIPNTKFLIVGDGDYKFELEKIALQLNISNSVEFKGFVSEEEKVELLQSMHLVIQPSMKEGWGLTIIEANACGTIAIASNVEGLRESVLHEKTGLLFEYGNVDELAEKIIFVLQNENVRIEFEKNAIEFAKKFDWENSAKSLVEKIYELKK